MNIACPSCSTRYSVDDARIPPSGVTIKCPKCQHVFVAKRDAAPRASQPGIAGGAVPLPGNAAPGSRGSPVPLPGRSAGSQPRPQAPPRPSANDDADLDLGLDDPSVAQPASKIAQRPSAAPPRPPPPQRPPQGGTRSAADALGFIDEAAARSGVVQAGHSPEFRVRRRNGRIEGPFGVGRIIAMLKAKELSGGEDISEDGLAWRSMTSNPQLNQVINEIAQASEGDAFSFGQVDLPMPASDLPAPASHRELPDIRRGVPGKNRSAPAGAGGLELSSPLDGLAGHRGGARGTGDLDLGFDGGGTGRPPFPPAMQKAKSGHGTTGDLAQALEDLDSSAGGDARASRPGRSPTADLDGSFPSGQNPEALEVADIPELPPIWQTYRKHILAFTGIAAFFLVGFFTHIWTPYGAYGIRWFGTLLEPPPPPPPEAPPAPPPKVADPQQIASLIDEGSFEAFRSVFVTVEKLGPTLPDNMLAVAKARGFATLAYGTSAFAVADLAKAVEALDKLDLASALGGNTSAAAAEALKARAALQIVSNANASAESQLAEALTRKPDDKEIAFLLGVTELRLGKITEALEALDKAIVIDAKFAPALHAIGDVVASQGSMEDAAAWYLKALAAQPFHTRSGIAAASIYAQLNMQGQRRRTLALSGDGVARGLPQEKQAAFLYEAAKAFDDADLPGKAVSLATEAARLEPAKAQYVSLAAVALANAVRIPQALALLDPLLVREPTNTEALLARARVHMRAEDVAKAFIDLEAAKKLAPRDARLMLWEARFDLDLGKLTDAREVLGRAVNLEGAGPIPHIELGRIDLTVGDVDAAFKNATEAVKKDPNSSAAHALLGDCFRLRDELEKAIDSYQAALKLDDENVAAIVGYANALRDMGAKSSKVLHKVSESIPRYLQALAENPRNPTIMFEYGRALEIKNDVKGALELYREAAALDEKDVRPHLKMAAAYIEQDEPDLPSAGKSVAVARRIEAGAGRVNGHVRFWEARLALLENRVHDAEAAMRAAVEAEPRNAVFHYWLGRVLEANNSLYEAIGYYEKAVSLNSRLAVAHRALGWTAIERNQFDKAREAFARYRESAPDDYSIWGDIGESYAKQNMDDEAMAAFQKALKFDPNDSKALLQIGGILDRKGQGKEALEFFERAAKADPNNGDAWCNYGLSLNSREKLAKGAKEALKRCLSLPNASEDLKANAQEALETSGGRSN